MIPPKLPPGRVAQSRETRSIRFSDAEWAPIVEQARARGIEPSRLARQLCLMGLRVLLVEESLEAGRRPTVSYGA